MTEWQPIRVGRDALARQLAVATKQLREALSSIRAKDQELAALEAVVYTLRALGEQSWQPIETAPRDGTLILAYRPPTETRGSRSAIYCTWFCSEDDPDWDEPTVSGLETGGEKGYWQPPLELDFVSWMESQEDFSDVEWDNPTHWMPMPEPPK